jgi:phosphohistidine phosphatase SixA
MRLRPSLFALAITALFAMSAGAQPSTVIVVRHAEKSTAPPANDPVLSAEGTQRALDLAAALSSAKVTTVIATQFQRTQLTAKPISDALGKAPTIVAAANPMPAHLAAVAAAVRAVPAGEVVLVVGHSNTVPGIVAALGGPKMPDLCDPQYSTMFILEFGTSGAPRMIKANYGAPDAKDAAACNAAK